MRVARTSSGVVTPTARTMPFLSTTTLWGTPRRPRRVMYSPVVSSSDRALDVVDLAEMEGLASWIHVLPHVDHDDLEPELRGPTANFLE